MRTFAIIILSTLIFFITTPGGGFKGKSPVMPGTIIIKFKNNHISPKAGRLNLPAIDEKISRFNISKIEKYYPKNDMEDDIRFQDLKKIHIARFPENKSMEGLLDILNNSPEIEYAEPLYLSRLHSISPNDSLLSEQYHLFQIQAFQAWDIHQGENGDTSVVIGMVDTGLDWDHPDIAENLWRNLGEDIDKDGKVVVMSDSGWTFDPDDINGIDDDGNGYVDDFIGWNFCSNHDWEAEESNNPDDPCGHGTHVGGIASAVTNNAIGVAGISWNVKLAACSHSIYLPSYDDYFIYLDTKGIVYLAENGADVINCSYGSEGYSQLKQDACQYAWRLGSQVVVSAGNSGSSNLQYPAACSKVLAVGNTNMTDALSWSSNKGAYVNLFAPGQSILSSLPHGEYGKKSGTSMSSPLVAGLFALVKSYHPQWTNLEVTQHIIATCDNIDEQNPEMETPIGAGRINAYRALSEDGPKSYEEYRIEFNKKPSFMVNGAPSSLTPGSKGTIPLQFRNYSFFSEESEVNFILSTNDTSIQLIKNTASVKIPINDTINVENAFEIKIKENTTPRVTDFTISIQTETPVVFGDSFNFQLITAPGGFLVYDKDKSDENSNGKIFHDMLTQQGYEALYTDVTPIDLGHYQGVFIISPDDAYYSDDTFDFEESLVSYLRNGGKVFIEKNTHLFSYNDSLQSLLGINDILFHTNNSVISEITGDPGSIAEGLFYEGNTRLEAPYTFTSNTNGKSLFHGRDVGVIGIENHGAYGQKSIFIDFPVSKLKESNNSSTQKKFLSLVLDFFDYPAPMYCDYTFSPITNQGEINSILFNDRSSYPGEENEAAFEWDFDNDGITDSREINPTWSPSSEGIFHPGLKVILEKDTLPSNKEDTIFYYKTGNSIKINEGEIYYDGSITIPQYSDDPELSSFSWEFMLKVDTAGYYDYYAYYFNLLNNKENLFLGFVDSSTIYLVVDFSDESYIDEKIHLEDFDPLNWNHLLLSCDGTNGCISLYCNGESEYTYQSDTKPIYFYKDTSNTRTVKMVLGNHRGVVLDDIKMWNTSFSDEEADLAYRDEETGKEEYLQGHWDCNELSGNLLIDKTEGEHHGVIQNCQRVKGYKRISTPINESLDSAPYSSSPILLKNYPNPFHDQTKIRYYLPRKQNIEISIYNLMGEKVKTIFQGEAGEGFHKIDWKGINDRGKTVGSGIYFYQLKTENERKSRKLLLCR